jgi:hypothetical protein
MSRNLVIVAVIGQLFSVLSIPEIIACRFCGTTGPTVPQGEPIVTIEDFESTARKAGWHFEPDGWICPGCWVTRSNAER